MHGKLQVRHKHTYLRGVVRVAISPYQVQVILELSLGFVVLLFDLLEHGLEVHRVRDYYGWLSRNSCSKQVSSPS